MTDNEVVGCRRWAAHLTIDQMRATLDFEQTQEFSDLLTQKGITYSDYMVGFKPLRQRKR